MFQTSRNRRLRWVASATLVASLWGTAAWGQQAAGREEADRRAATRTSSRANTQAVVARITDSAAFLAAQERFSFEARNTFDVMQVNDQKLEFGSTQTATVRRPDRVRVDTLDRDGGRHSTTFDGDTIAIDLPDAHAYVSVAKPGRLDAAVEYLVEDLGKPAPLHEFLTDNYFDGLAEAVLSGFWVDTEKIGEQICDHLAFRGANVDVQLWLRVGDEPLPCRIVVTHADHPGHPQFASDFVAWDLAPETPDSLFSFSPPEGAERLPLQAVVQQRTDEVTGR